MTLRKHLVQIVALRDGWLGVRARSMAVVITLQSMSRGSDFGETETNHSSSRHTYGQRVLKESLAIDKNRLILSADEVEISLSRRLHLYLLILDI